MHPLLRVLFAGTAALLLGCAPGDDAPGNDAPDGDRPGEAVPGASASGVSAPGISASGDAQSIRLYVIDGGELVSNPGSYELGEDEVGTSLLSIAAYLIVHPRGVLLWDALGVADAERQAGGSGTQQTIVRSDNQNRYVTLAPPLTDQLSAAGYEPGDVTHLALSHYHWDHTANAGDFAHATWLVRPQERAEMFGTPGGSARPHTYAPLENAATIVIESDEYDVFGDGRVILLGAPGHTPGHQVLYVELEATGAVVLSGDLYHYPEERSLGRLPVFEFDRDATAASRAALERFMASRDATLWIGHDLLAHRALRKSPEYYD